MSMEPATFVLVGVWASSINGTTTSLVHMLAAIFESSPVMTKAFFRRRNDVTSRYITDRKALCPNR